MAVIPTIDLAAWRSERADEREAIVRAWSSAFCQHGLVYLSNHGLAPLYHRVCRQWLQFCSLQPQHKEKFSTKIHGEGGYSGLGKQAVAASLSSGESQVLLSDPVESLGNGFDDKFLGRFPREENGYIGGDSLRFKTFKSLSLLS